MGKFLTVCALLSTSLTAIAGTGPAQVTCSSTYLVGAKFGGDSETRQLQRLSSDELTATVELGTADGIARVKVTYNEANKNVAIIALQDGAITNSQTPSEKLTASVDVSDLTTVTCSVSGQ